MWLEQQGPSVAILPRVIDMFVAHPPNVLTSSKPTKRKHVEMDEGEDKHLVHKYVNEQGEHEEKKMSVNCLLNNPQEIVHIKANGMHNSSNGMFSHTLFLVCCTTPPTPPQKYQGYQTRPIAVRMPSMTDL